MVKYYAKDSNKKQRNCHGMCYCFGMPFTQAEAAPAAAATVAYTIVHNGFFGICCNKVWFERMLCLGDFVDPGGEMKHKSQRSRKTK